MYFDFFNEWIGLYCGILIFFEEFIINIVRKNEIYGIYYIILYVFNVILVIKCLGFNGYKWVRSYKYFY